MLEPICLTPPTPIASSGQNPLSNKLLIHLRARSQHDRENLIQRDWTGYSRSKLSDLHKHFCGEWLVMCGGVGEEPYLTAASKG